MRYQRSYRYVFSSPLWMTNLLAGTACFLVPLVGWSAFLGYAVELVDTLHHRKDSEYPSFDVNRLGQYMVRGLGPMIVLLLGLLPVLLLYLVSGVIGAQGGAGQNSIKLLVLLWWLASGLLGLLLTLLLLPLSLYIGLRQEVTLTDCRQFLVDFLKRVWQELLLAQVFVTVTGVSLIVLGVLPCGLGVGPAAALAGFSQYHLLGQLYRLYLERGGLVIPFKTEEPIPI